MPTLQHLTWASVALTLVAIGAVGWSMKATADASVRLDYYSACVAPGWQGPLAIGAACGIAALVVSIVFVSRARTERRRGLVVLASGMILSCVLGALMTGLVLLAHFCM